MSKKLDAVVLILSDSRGVYIPQHFLTEDNGEISVEHCATWGLTEENREHWGDAALDPETEGYWDAWQWVLDHAEHTTEDGDRYTLHQDGDLWGICLERMTAEEKSNFGFEED